MLPFLHPSTRGVPSLHTEAAGTAFPDAFGPFRVLHQIGAGALGPVFRAYEPDQDRLVAVKLFKLDLPPERVHQLVAELEKLIAADLTHPSIAAPIAAGISGTSAYFAQDFVAADSLDIVVRDHGPAPAADALRVATQLGGALDFAAAVDVLHGALHPRDVLVSSDDTRVIGLGVARALEHVGVAAPIRRPYTAPERAANAPWDRRADVFTLAALIYEMLAGKRLSTAADQAGETLSSVPGVDTAILKSVFAKALADDPAKRFGAALEFADALKGALTMASVAQASSPDPSKADGRWSRAVNPALSVESRAARGGREADVALPFEEPQPEGSFDIKKAFDVKEEPVDLPLRDDAEPVIQLREDTDAPKPEAPSPKARPKPVVRISKPEPEPEHRSLTAESPKPEPPKPDVEVAERRGSAPENGERRRVAPPTAFLDQSSDEFRQTALEKTRSAIWPLALAVGVGLVVGFAGGYGVAMRDRMLPSSTDASSVSAAAQAPMPPAATVPAPAPTAAPVAPAVAAPVAAAPQVTQDAQAKPDPPAVVAAPAPKPIAEAAERRRPEPVPASVANGRLVIRSTPPGAKVSVDGKDAGATPATVRELSIGPHTIRVAQDGYATSERRVVLTEERASQALRFELVKRAVPGVAAAPPAGPGGLMIESRPPGATVYIDGKLIGSTPMAIESVAAGDHTIGLMSDGYQRWTGSVRVATGERARVTASLER